MGHILNEYAVVCILVQHYYDYKILPLESQPTKGLGD
jgi:hypothetical protein